MSLTNQTRTGNHPYTKTSPTKANGSTTTAQEPMTNTNYQPSNLAFHLKDIPGDPSGNVYVQAVHIDDDGRCEVWQWGMIGIDFDDACRQCERMQRKVSEWDGCGWARGMRLPWSDPEGHSWRKVLDPRGVSGADGGVAPHSLVVVTEHALASGGKSVANQP